MSSPQSDPVPLEDIRQDAPGDYLGSRSAQCPYCGYETGQDGFRTLGSGWVGVSSPFVPQSTSGKPARIACLWICAECHNLVSCHILVSLEQAATA